MEREKIKLGRVGFVNKGTYDKTKKYEEWDMVTSEGSSYVYINSNPSIGVDVTDIDYWQCIAEGVGNLGRFKWRYNEQDNSLELIYID